MKTKFFSMLFVATALMFAACEDETGTSGTTDDGDVTITLDQSSLTLLEGETATIVATVSPEGTEVVWTSSNEEYVTVDQDGVVTGVAIGSAFVYATAGGQVANCVVAVQEDASTKEYPSLEGTEYYPFILDSYTAEEIADLIVYDFRPNDTDRFLYIWDDTYSAATTSGLNFYGNDGGYTGLYVGTSGWSGAGYVVDGAEAEALWNSIQAAPEEYYLHLAMKSTDSYSHCFYILGCGDADAKIGIGPTSVYDAPIFTDFTRDGEWQEMEICLSELNLDGFTSVSDGSGINALVVLTEGTSGAALNLDAAFIYRK
ncbi:MAG: Ig-like domain-containing protein [bacterium]